MLKNVLLTAVGLGLIGVMRLGFNAVALRVFGETVAGELNFVELPRPQFAYTWSIVDTCETCNGAGIAQRGEDITFVLDVTNVGTGKALDTFTSIRNASDANIFIEKGRFKLGELDSALAPHGDQEKSSMVGLITNSGTWARGGNLTSRRTTSAISWGCRIDSRRPSFTVTPTRSPRASSSGVLTSPE